MERIPRHRDRRGTATDSGSGTATDSGSGTATDSSAGDTIYVPLGSFSRNRPSERYFVASKPLQTLDLLPFRKGFRNSMEQTGLSGRSTGMATTLRQSLDSLPLPSVCICGARLDSDDGTDLRPEHRLCGLPSVCICGARLDGADGTDLRPRHRLCGRTIGDVLRPSRRAAPLAPWLASDDDKVAAWWRAQTIADRTTRSGRQFIDPSFRADWHKGKAVRADRTVRPTAERKSWRTMRRAAMASLATDAPMAFAELSNRGNPSVALHPEGAAALRAELVSMPASLAFLIRLEASAFDRGEWKDEDGYTRRAKRDPSGPLASATLSRVWEAAALSTGNNVSSVLALTRNAARWLFRGDRRTGGAIGGKLDRLKMDEAKAAARTKAGKAIDALPARQRALLAERLADCPSLALIAERIADIQAGAVGRNQTDSETEAIDYLRTVLARGLAIV